MFGTKKDDVKEKEKNSKVVYDFETDETDFFMNSNSEKQNYSTPQEYQEDEIDEDEYEKVSFGKIIRIIFLFILIVVILIFLWIFNSPSFVINEVEITDTKSESYESIYNITNTAIGQNIFLEDLSKMKEDILKLSHVRKVEIKRQLPSKLLITYTERQPYVMVKKGSEYYILDRDGYILEINLVDNVYDIPLVKGILEENDFSGEKITSTDSVILKNIEYLLESMEHINFEYAISNIEYSPVSGISFLIKYTELNVKFGHIKKDQINDKLLYLKEIVRQSVEQKYKGTLDISSDNYNEKSVLINNY